MRSGKELLLEGAVAAPSRIRRSSFCRKFKVESELAFKEACMASRTITYHMQVGLNTWPDTRDQIRQVVDETAEAGHTVHRFGLTLDRGMSVPESRRDEARKETGPRLETDDWADLAEVAPAQPHMGDFMIGTPASLENTLHALSAGITTIGNLGQYFAFDPPPGWDDVATTEATIQALGAMASKRNAGALVHSYLDDGLAVQFTHYGYHVGWAALERYVVEELCGARIGHCFGGLVPDPTARAVLMFALDELHDRKHVGAFVYGNTVDYTRDHVANRAILSTCTLIDIATQLHRPTGHAIMPVPVTENERIPSAEEIVEVQLLARALEREARRSDRLFDWAGFEKLGGELADFGRRFAHRVLALLEKDGVQTDDPAAMLLALRRAVPSELERRAQVPASKAVAGLEQWKTTTAGRHAEAIRQSSPSLTGVRVVLVVVDVHDLIRDAIAKALPVLGAEVILLASDSQPAMIARAAVDEDADAVIVGTYNGSALSLGEDLMTALGEGGFEGLVIFGGVLNQDTGEALPTDVRPHLTALGIRCVDRVEDLGPALSGTADKPVHLDVG
jgi:methylmalonyl-CoA mutase cobalamin-binding domain/chain